MFKLTTPALYAFHPNSSKKFRERCSFRANVAWLYLSRIRVESWVSQDPRQGSDWSSTTPTTTATRKERFAKPGREFRAINYRDRLGRFAKGIRKYPVTWATSVRETGGVGSRYIPDILKVFRGPVELDKFVASRTAPTPAVDLPILTPSRKGALREDRNRPDTVTSNLRYLVATNIGEIGAYRVSRLRVSLLSDRGESGNRRCGILNR
ncbi:hypothetical protein K0M31_004901 [Melipona bicolor]|uniref:Uncharacterized protein n=1 Tax=Melipona bicolor TaxID=60889 RepID=A0AA40FWQ9_9HYME|nr:hypothetical protein K0M31_004901 [Melipona bicolor]